MPVNLKTAVKKTGRRKPIILRPIEPSSVLETEARAIGRSIVRGWEALLPDILNVYASVLISAQPLPGTAIDAAGDPLTTLLEADRESMLRLVLAADPMLDRWTRRIEEWHRKKFARVVRIGTDVDIYPFLSAADVENMIAASLEGHVALIRDLNANLEKRVAQTVWQGFRNQVPRREMGKQLAEQIKIGRRRADFIAKDQTLKLSGDLDRARQEDAGIRKYVWRTAEDERVRPTHAARNRKIYRWDGPGIKPRQEPNCRCTAQAYIDLMEEAGVSPAR